MNAIELISANLLSPVILCFGLGILATAVRSDLRFPEELYQAISIYLLLAIGMKGGVALVSTGGSAVWLPLLGAFAISAATPLWCYPLLRLGGKLNREDAAALCAHYGSVSVVTFLAGISFLQALSEPFEGFLPALLAIMEFPAIVVALMILNPPNQGKMAWFVPLKRVLASRSVFLLLGGLLIGIMSGERGYAKVEPFFTVPFQGVLCLFLLEMGMVASRRFPDLRKVSPFVLGFACLIPFVHAVAGIIIGDLCGLSRGGAFILGVLAASASYIAAPATIRLAVPAANPAIYLTGSLAVTFPLNLTIGLPVYYALAGWIVR